MFASSWIRRTALAALVAFGTVGTALADGEDHHGHVDIWPNVTTLPTGGKKLQAGKFDFDESKPIEVSSKVFLYDFAEDPTDPHFIGDPGFASGPNSGAGGSGLANGSQLRFNSIGPLLFWNGADPLNHLSDFTATPDGEAIKLNRGSNNLTITDSSSDQTGFLIGTSNNGALHAHLNTFLLGSDGNFDAFDGIAAAIGIYAIKLELWTNEAGISKSDPFHVLYNNGLDEELHEQAERVLDGTWVPPVAVPLPAAAPAGLALLGLLALHHRMSRRKAA